MNTDNILIQNKKDPTVIFTEFPVLKKGIALGLIAGIGMATYLFILETLGQETSIGLKFMKYIVLIGVLMFGLSRFKMNYTKQFDFKKGALYGGMITLVSTIVLIGLDLVAWTITDEFGYNKFGVESSNFGDFITIAAMIAMETFVYGMIITFIILQSLKKRKPLA